MKTLMTLTLVAALIGGCATADLASTGPAKVQNGVLTGPNAMTLYTCDRDVAGSGKSVCNGPCATNWPPLLASDADKAKGDYTVITRDDGKEDLVIEVSRRQNLLVEEGQHVDAGTSLTEGAPSLERLAAFEDVFLMLAALCALAMLAARHLNQPVPRHPGE